MWCGVLCQVTGGSDAMRTSAELINGQLHLSFTNGTSACAQSELQVSMKGYPPYVAKLAPFEGRRINLTNLRPVIPQHRIGRDAWYAPKGGGRTAVDAVYFDRMEIRAE